MTRPRLAVAVRVKPKALTAYSPYSAVAVYFLTITFSVSRFTDVIGT